MRKSLGWPHTYHSRLKFPLRPSAPASPAPGARGQEMPTKPPPPHDQRPARHGDGEDSRQWQGGKPKKLGFVRRTGPTSPHRCPVPARHPGPCEKTFLWQQSRVIFFRDDAHHTRPGSCAGAYWLRWGISTVLGLMLIVSRILAQGRLTVHWGYRDTRCWLSRAFGGHRDHVSRK